jgi:uncharacterized RDD family membrane protein YckC
MTTNARFTEERRRALAEFGQARPLVPGLISRLLAFSADILVMVLACVFATHLIDWTAMFFRLGKVAIGQQLVDFASRAAVLLVTTLYLPLSWTLTGQSVGKALFGLCVVRNDPQRRTMTKLSLVRSFVRVAGYWLSALPLGLGFLCAALDEEHRALHDRLAGSRVVYQPASRGRSSVAHNSR